MLLHKKIQVLGVHGLADAGKTTAATILEDLTGFKRIAFADSVKTPLQPCTILISIVSTKKPPPETFAETPQ